MKLLFVISSLDPKNGGVSEGIMRVTAACRRLGHQTAILTLDAPDAPFIPTLAGTVIPMGPCAFGYQYSARLVPWIKSNARDYDAVIVEGLWQYHGFAVWRALAGGPIPYYVFPHGMLDPWFNKMYPMKRIRKWLYWPWGEYRVLRDARSVVFTCEEERNLARRSFWLYKVREAVTGYGTADPDYSPLQASAAFSSRFPHLAGKRSVLFVGRIAEKKGCDLLIESFAKVASKDARLHLVMMGPQNDGDPWAQSLRDLIVRRGLQDRVTWTGMLTGAEKWGAFEAAEVFALPSHQENFGVAVVEAMACAVPVLISDKVNIWREVVEAKAGWVGADTVEGTTEALNAWLACDEKKLGQIKENARNCFDARFRVEGVAQRLTALIEAGVSNERSGDPGFSYR